MYNVSSQEVISVIIDAIDIILTLSTCTVAILYLVRCCELDKLDYKRYVKQMALRRKLQRQEEFLKEYEIFFRENYK